MIIRLTGGWHDEAEAFDQRSLSDNEYVYVWVDGIVRHAALCDRAGVQDPRRPVVVATG
jgi:transposase-like protein